MENNIAPSIFDELQSNQRHFEYATTGQRFANYCIDLVVFYLFNLLMFFILGAVLAVTGSTNETIVAVFSNKLVLYSFATINMMIIYTLVEGFTKGRTLGKLITGTIAVKEDLSQITWNEAVIRSAVRLIPFEPLSAFGTPWHDKLSETIVIKKNRQIL